MAKVLIVEDSDDLQFIFSWVFKSKGHAVEVISNGKDALRYLEYATPDVLVLDINLPGASGLDIARYARSQDRFERSNLIFVTGNQMYQSSPESELADLFLLKPVDPLMLVTMTDRLLTRQYAQKVV
ncbi:MAG: response regulator [Anaerolineae bacterium]|jgi:DNA-binding response OmpR family regulator|nr:response regulator [Anaerolineae bacterium]